MNKLLSCFTFLVFFGLPLFWYPLHAHAEFNIGSEDETCPSIDFRERFGPAKNQGFHQICWAMAGSALIEEEACLMDPRYCGMNFSPVDIASCDPKVGHTHEESVVDRALNCAKIRGVCPNNLAPFVDFRIKQSLISSITRSQRFQRSPVFNLFNRYKIAQRHKMQSIQNNSHLKEIEQSFIKEFRKTFAANDFSENQLLHILKKSKDPVELIDKTLIPNACSANRVQFPEMGGVFTRIFPEVNHRILHYYSKEEASQFSAMNFTQSQTIISRLKTGRSLSLSICPEKFSFIEDIMIPGGDCVEGHAIVANALRRNPQTKMCEIHLLDSRKEASFQFNGWFKLEDIANATIAITQIVPNNTKR